jgi:hypothetical protein
VAALKDKIEGMFEGEELKSVKMMIIKYLAGGK